MSQKDLNTGGWRKPPCVIEDHQLSYTGKYWGFFGTHFHQGIKCWQVGAVNTEDGVTTSRHYNERITVNEILAKKTAQKYWEEFKEILHHKPTEEERATDQALLEAWNDSARRSAELAKGRSRKPN